MRAQYRISTPCMLDTFAWSAAAVSMQQCGDIPLHKASLAGKLDIIMHLLSCGADVNAKGEAGNTPLHQASYCGKLDIVKHLVSCGADVHAKNEDGATPIDVAKRKGREDVAKFLLEAKPQLQHPTTALMTGKVQQPTATSPSLRQEKTVGTTPSDEAKRDGAESLHNEASPQVQHPQVTGKVQQPAATPPSSTQEKTKVSLQTSSQAATVRAVEYKYDMFLTHNWGDDPGHLNHQMVAAINKRLQSLGFVTWFDEDRMVGNIDHQMMQGINQSKIVLVFLTDRYMEKLLDPNDNCAQEFSYAANNKGVEKMVPIVMEEALKNQKAWTGMANMKLGRTLFVPMTNEAEVDGNMGKLVQILASMGVHPRK
eukprot:jgi/Mesvir1/18267/Mv09536-RA.1